MSKAAIVLAVILGVGLFIGLWIAGNYNSLVSSRNQVDKSWASVETQYQRRMDLIDNLVASVKGAQGQERAVFIAIADARTRYNNASTQEEKVAAANDIETNVALLPRLQEAYPELRSTELVGSLMTDLKGTEDGILKARDTYNTTANNYNTQIQRFPKNLFASSFGFDARTLFKADTGAATAPTVSF